jgi:hypothetical protein
MTSFELLLNEFDLALRKYNPVNYARLYPPLAELELEASLKNLKINNEDFGTLYKWKNGFDFNLNIFISCQIFDRGTLLSMSLVRQEVLLNQEEDTWKKTFIPFIANATGEYLLFNNEMGKDYEKIFFYSPSISSAALKPVSCYDSLALLIETTINAYKNNIFEYEEKRDRLKRDVYKYFELAKAKNSKSDFWKSESG